MPKPNHEITQEQFDELLKKPYVKGFTETPFGKFPNYTDDFLAAQRGVEKAFFAQMFPENHHEIDPKTGAVRNFIIYK